MKNTFTTWFVAGLCGWFLADADYAAAQARRGGERSAPAPRPAPAARTPSLSPQPAPRPVVPPQPVQPRPVQPRPVQPRVNTPVTINQHIQLPAYNPRPLPRPANPQTVVTLPKREEIVKTQPKVPPRVPPVVQHRPTNVPGSVAVLPSQGVTRPDLSRVRDLPREQTITRAVKPTTVTKAEINRKMNEAWAKRPREENPGRDRIAKYHDRAVAARDHLERDFRRERWFSPSWWDRHRFERRPWWSYLNYWGNRPYYYWWRPATWALTTGWLIGNWGQPIYYDYGSNVVYRDNYVYVNDVPIAPADLYADQAIELANAPPPPEGATIDWMPLGTFGLASTQDNAQPDIVLQLALSKDGFVSGTSYNTANQTENLVAGRVDPATQRLAIHFGDDTNIVLETGLYNLTQESTPVLIHFGTLTTQEWFLVRLPAPPQP